MSSGWPLRRFPYDPPMGALSGRLKSAAHSASQRVGFEITRWRDVGAYPESAFRPRVRFLSSIGATTLLDVGANRGQYARALRAAGYEGRIISFEPVAEPYRELCGHAAADPLWEVLPFALSDVDDEADINVAENTAGSSFLTVGGRLTESYSEMAFVGSERVRRRRLDGLAPTMSVSDAFLKLDVQGYERWVLEGAGDALGRIRGIELELSFEPMYEGEATFLEMTNALDDLGFALAATLPGVEDRSTGLPLQVDALFARTSGSGRFQAKRAEAGSVSAPVNPPG